MTDKMIAVPMDLLEELRDCAEICADDVRAHDLGEDSAETHFRQVGRACDALLREAPQPPFQLPDFATDPDDSDEVASLWDHGFKRGWNSCLGSVAKAMQPAEQQPAPDVAGLVDALEWVMYCNEFGFLPESVQQAVSDALALYRNQGGGK